MLAKWFNSQQAILVLTNPHLMPLMLQKVPGGSPCSNKRIPQICQFSTKCIRQTYLYAVAMQPASPCKIVTVPRSKGNGYK
jgi:hypothetical protein